MHSQTHRHLLEQLGCLYGSGALPDRHGRVIDARRAGQIHGHEGDDGLNPTMPSGSAPIPVADAPITGTVLGEPPDDALVEIASRRCFQDPAENASRHPTHFDDRASPLGCQGFTRWHRRQAWPEAGTS
jgi:hypothetical protein